MADRRLTPIPDDPRHVRRWTPPSLTATGGPMPLRAPLRSAIYVILIGLTAAGLIYSLQGVIARNQRIQVRLAEMEGAINLLNAREWEARTGVISSEHHNDVAQSQEHLRAILAELRERTGIQQKSAPPAPPTSGPGLVTVQQVETDVGHYLVAVDSMFHLLARDQRLQAQALAEQTVDPAFENLRISLAAARDYYATAGQHAIRLANIASLLGVLLAMSLIWGLLGRAARQRTETQALTTERRTLAASEARWRALILNGEDAILVVDPTGAVGYASPNADRVLGLPPGGLGDSVLSALPPALRPALLVLLEASQREPGRPRVQELQLTDGGAPRFLEVVATNLLADSAVNGIVLNLRDLTERRAMEEALRQSQEQLLHAQKMEALGRLAGGIAHDFNNLMMAISGYTELVLQDASISPTSRDDVAQIRRAVFRAAELTQQILAYSRRQMLQPVPVSLNLLLGEASGMLRRLMPENIELRLALDPKLPDVLVDPGHMLQVVMNLALNARDAMPNGGTLGIRTTAAGATGSDEGNGAGPHAQLVVTDSGTGIDAKVLPLIFDPFFTTKPQGEGSGLGLSTVYGIIKQSGGQIDVQSELTRGTTFTITLPAAPPVPAREDPSDAQNPPRSGGEVILVVEDDDQVRTVVSKGLPRLGYEVLVVGNAEEALALVDKHPGRIDLLLTDVVMPGLSGPQLADRLAQRRPETRVVFMSGYPEAQDPALGFSLNGRSYLQKPFALAELAEKIRLALDE
jgi:two-component system, cell cycle sensor histidine kinase and response regulator CckA